MFDDMIMPQNLHLFPEWFYHSLMIIVIVHLLRILTSITCVLRVRTHVKIRSCRNCLHLVLEVLSGMSWSGVSSIGSGFVQGLFQDSPSSEEWRPSDHTVPRWAPTCCNWIRCSPSVMVWPCSLFHPLPLFLGRSRYVLLVCNQGSIHF